MICYFCEKPYNSKMPFSKFCSKRCRRNFWKSMKRMEDRINKLFDKGNSSSEIFKMVLKGYRIKLRNKK